MTETVVRREHGRVLHWLLLAVAVLGLLWPAFLNGEPLLFPDTSAYVRAADAAAFQVTGHKTEWTRDGEVARMSGKAAATSALPDRDRSRVPLLGRSIYYGVIAYASSLTGSFWPLVVLQALAVGIAAWLLQRRFLGREEPGSPLRVGVLLLVLAACSTAPFFCSFAMPDLFAGVGILAGALLLSDSGASSRGEYLVAVALACLAALFHSSHVLLLISLLVLAGAAWLVARVPVSRRGLLGVAAAIAVGLVGEALFVQAVGLATGQAPIRPPFLTARLINDGPGYDYLRRTCPQNGLYVCRFVSRLPLPSDGFLWNEPPAVGVFSTLDAGGKRRLAAEQGRFVLQVLADRPFDVVASSARSAVQQLGRFGLAEFNYPGMLDAAGLPAAEQARVKASLAWRGEMPTVGFGLVAAVAAALALVVLLALSWRRRIDWRLAALVIGGVVLNSVICGALSTPHDRYGARVLWLLPLVAAAALLTPRSSWRASASNQPRP